MSCAREFDVEYSRMSKTEAVQCPDLSESNSSDNKSGAQNNKENSEDVLELLEAVPELDSAFNVMNKIGSGTFSSVYLASLKTKQSPRELFALKHLIPTSHPSRIENEIRCLKELGGQCNVVPILACVRHLDHVVIIMPYIEHDKFQDYVQNMTVDEVRAYMFALLTAVRHVHSINVIHRDIKHSNFLCNRKLRQFALVDFGLAQRVTTSAEELASDSSSRLKLSSPLKDGSVPAANVKQINSPKIKAAQFDENLKLVSSDKESVGSPATGSDKSVTASCSLLQAVNVNASLTDSNILKSVNNCAPNKQKSPRRTLLTKRVLDIQRQNYSTVNAPVPSRQTFIKKSGLGLNSNGQYGSSSLPKPVCRCFGRPMVCNVCLARSAERAPRAGTPGYRAPEVLMKYPKQTTAVDLWSVGVIFLSLLSGHYPIFKATDDLQALSQIICIFGSEEVKSAAKKYGKQVDCSLTSPAVDLKTLCQGLRQSHALSVQQATRDSWSSVPDSVYHLLKRLLDVNPFTRITAADALEHSFFIDSHA